tara:strand:+ start:211 stop:522 length:312 start_codon:yes stop_codon:yes gene_type:complete
MIGKCSDIQCKLMASFGPSDTRIRIYCSKHKKTGMINVVNPICLEPECTTQATFGVVECKKMFCSKHKKPGMEHLSKHPKSSNMLPPNVTGNEIVNNRLCFPE